MLTRESNGLPAVGSGKKFSCCKHIDMDQIHLMYRKFFS